MDRQEQLEKHQQQRFLTSLVTGFAVLCIVMAVGGIGWHYFYGPCGVNRVKASNQTLSTQFQAFNDAFDIAERTSRIALSGPIAEIQKIKRETETIEVPTCLEPAKHELLLSMDTALNGFLAFLAEESDATVSAHFNESVNHMGAFNEALISVGECAPFCQTK